MTAAQPSPSTRSPRLSPNSAFALRPLRLSVILRRVFATPALTLAPSTSCGLFVVAKKINSFAIKQIQTLLQKHPGGTSAHPRHPSIPPSYAPRGASIPCALIRLRILPVTTGVYPLRPSDFSAFVADTIGSPFVFIFLRIAFPTTPLFSQPSPLPGDVGAAATLRWTRG